MKPIKPIRSVAINESVAPLPYCAHLLNDLVSGAGADELQLLAGNFNSLFVGCFAVATKCVGRQSQASPYGCVCYCTAHLPCTTVHHHHRLRRLDPHTQSATHRCCFCSTSPAQFASLHVRYPLQLIKDRRILDSVYRARSKAWTILWGHYVCNALIQHGRKGLSLLGPL